MVVAYLKAGKYLSYIKYYPRVIKLYKKGEN